MYDKKKEVVFWPLLWFVMMNKVLGFAREGMLRATSMVRLARLSMVLAVITPIVILFVAPSWAISTRIIFVIGAWVIGMFIRSWGFNRAVSLSQWIGVIFQALLFGLFWGTLLSFLFMPLLSML